MYKSSILFHYFMKHLSYCLLICSVFLMIVSGCSKSSQDPVLNYSTLAFFHGAPSSPPLNVVLDGSKLNSSAFEYGSFSGSISVTSGTRILQFTSYVNNLTLIDTTFTLGTAKGYSVFVINKQFTIKPLITLDEAEFTSASSNMMIRFIHLSPDTPAAYVAIAGETASLLPARTYQQVNAFTETPSKTYIFEVRALSDNSLLGTTASLNFQAGAYYTVALYGYSKPPAGNTNKLAAKILEF